MKMSVSNSNFFPDYTIAGSSVQKTKKVREIYTGSDVSKLLDNSKLLIHAVKLGNEVLVRKLLDHGIPQYISDQLGCNPLYYAARYNHVGMVKILMDAGGQVNVFTKTKRTPLQIAAFHGHIEIVEILIQNNADVNALDLLGMSALHWAAENNHLETVKVLLYAGANRTLVNKFGRTARTLAFAKNHYETYDLLMNWSNSKYSLYKNSPNENTEQCTSNPTAVFATETGNKFSEISSIAKQHLRDGLQNKIRTELPLKIHDNENEIIDLVDDDEIESLPSEQSTITVDTIQRRQTAALTASDKTKPNFIQRTVNLSDEESHVSSTSSVNGIQIDETAKTNNCTERETQCKRKNLNEENISKTKIIKIDAQELVNLTANKKLIIRPAVANSSSTTTDANSATTKTDANTATTKTFVKQTENQNSNPQPKENSTVINGTASNLAVELNRKNFLIKYMKKQLEMSMSLAKHYKTKCDAKEREALLYKTQLLNLMKLLSKPGVKSVTVS